MLRRAALDFAGFVPTRAQRSGITEQHGRIVPHRKERIPQCCGASVHGNSEEIEYRIAACENGARCREQNGYCQKHARQAEVHRWESSAC